MARRAASCLAALAPALVALAACGSPAATTDASGDGAHHGDGGSPDAPAIVSASSFTDKVMIGYQGWFAAAGDGSPLNVWNHWGHGEPAPGNVTFELYPDVRDYPASDTYACALGTLGSGAPAKLFGSWSDGVIETHFRWLVDNGIDGVAVQRFISELGDPRYLRQRNEVAAKVRAAAERHGRVFYLAYDISGANGTTWVDDIKADFTSNVSALFASPQYVHQNGKPVLMVWGFGFPDRPGDGTQALALIQWLKAQGVYVIGGVPYTWRTGANTKAGFTSAFAALDMIQPWAVGAVITDNDVDSHFADIVAKDKLLTSSRGQDYQRVIFPGFAWSNWNGGTRNMIPRRAGGLFWRQAYRAAVTSTSVMIAMFDEYDEGTAIARAAEDVTQIPTSQYFLTLDADGVHLSADFYVRLAGAATAMLHGAAPVQSTIPIANN